jgi:hypothetical protein
MQWLLLLHDQKGQGNLHSLKVSWLYLRVNHGQGKI